VDRSQVTTSNPVVTPATQVISTANNGSAAGTYTVKKGDGLYRIALDNGVAYKDLATWNGITDVNGLKIGQVLRLSPSNEQINSGVEVRPLQDVGSSTVATSGKELTSTVVKKYPRAVKESYSEHAASSVTALAEGEKVVLKQQNISTPEKPVLTKPNPTTPAASKVENADKTSAAVASSPSDSNTSATNWGAPTAGKVVSSFTVERKGIDIAGQMGQSIVASGSGKVVYAGAGLRGYGKMIIIQHSDGFLSAYAHNSKLIVKENDVVKKGEKIAEMGNTDSDQVKLHFELRKFGKPVDPSNYIKLN
jgi:lipoprotein NlpD